MRTDTHVSSTSATVDGANLRICDATFHAHKSGALWWAEQHTLIVADLHLEKGSSYARRGAFLPPYDSRTTLNRLMETITHYRANRVILLGDSFHDVDGMGRLPDEERATLRELQSRCEWVWITGNHDPSISDRLGGVVSDELCEHDLIFRHEPSDGAVVGEIAGHLHPAARIVRHGRSMRRRCFIENGIRMVLPAFGAYAGGLNVCHPAFDTAFRPGGDSVRPRIWMMGETAVFAIAETELKSD